MIQLDTIWIVGGKMSIGFKLIQIIVRPSESGFQNNICQIKLSNNQTSNESSEVTNTTLVDDDEEENTTIIPVAIPTTEPEPTLPTPEPTPPTPVAPTPTETTKPKKPLLKKKTT